MPNSPLLLVMHGVDEQDTAGRRTPSVFCCDVGGDHREGVSLIGCTFTLCHHLCGGLCSVSHVFLYQWPRVHE